MVVYWFLLQILLVGKRYIRFQICNLRHVVRVVHLSRLFNYNIGVLQVIATCIIGSEVLQGRDAIDCRVLHVVR